MVAYGVNPGHPQDPRRPVPDPLLRRYLSVSESGEYDQVWLYVSTEALAAGSGYRTVLHVGEDVSIPLIGDTAARYANAVITLVSRAVHDAAVYNQWVHGRKAPAEVAAGILLRDLAPDRPPVEQDIPLPLRLEPGVLVSHTTGRARGVLKLLDPSAVSGRRLHSAEALHHALHVLVLRAASELDTAYGSFLCRVSGRSKAAEVVHELQLWVDDGLGPEPTRKRLTRDLLEAKAPPQMVAKAFEGGYDEFVSPDAEPIGQLAAELHAAGLQEMADRALGGEWAASAAEAQAWGESEQGRAVFGQIIRSVVDGLTVHAPPGQRQTGTPRPRPAHSRGRKKRRRK